MYKYKFSFVMPVYNVADYLPETVESVIHQTLNFEDNVEIIFVNDGSPDDVESICLAYKEKYPNNIKYVKQANAGLSAARNTGLKEVEGKYVSFLDSDDKISRNTLKEVYDFFEEHYDEIDFVTMNVEFFEGKTGGHPLNYAVQGDRVVDVVEGWQDLHIQIASCFLKQEVFTERGYGFNPVIRRFAEDMELLGRLILDTMKYGTVSRPTYYYRKRKTGGSIVDSSLSAPDWYEQTPELVYKRVFDYSDDKLGYVPKYIQYMVMYDLQWRLRQKKKPDFDAAFLDAYKRKLAALLKRIDNDVIFAQRYLEYGLKLFALQLKYEAKKLDTLFDVEDGWLTADGEKVIDLSAEFFQAYVTVINRTGNKLVVEGLTDKLYTQKVVQVPTIDGVEVKQLPATLTRSIRFQGETVYSQVPFKFEVELNNPVIVRIERRVNDKHVADLPLVTRKQTRLNYMSNFSYRLFGEWVLRRKFKYLRIEPYRQLKRPVYELLYELSLLKHKKIKSIIIRWAYFVVQPFLKRKDIWIVSDRVNAAGDNGEAFFRYVTSIKQPRNRKLLFAVSKNTADYTNLKQYGRVIDRYSLRYYLMFIFANKVISSHADDFVINPYGSLEHTISDLFRFDFVFLQHGIIHGDLSGWINKMNKNIKVLVTTTKQEYDSILDGNYGYDKSVVKLTGLPRYDLLDSQPKGKLILAPTWRHNLIGDADRRGIREYNDTFKDSEYYEFYQRLIKDKRINDALVKYNMTGEFYLHPSLEPQIADFEGAEHFKIKEFPYDYRTAFNEGNILVSDFSSVVFDFAYLKKPVIYTQFDADTYFDKHMHDKGYYDHREHGFGPIAYNYEDAVEEIVAAIKHPVLEAKYLQRVNAFYDKFDKHNAERVYKEIQKL